MRDDQASQARTVVGSEGSLLVLLAVYAAGLIGAALYALLVA